MSGKNCMEPEKLRETLSWNIKKERKKLGLTQEKLAEIADLSSQTINDIEGCRMWVSDKTMIKLASVLHVEAYELLVPENPDETHRALHKRRAEAYNALARLSICAENKSPEEIAGEIAEHLEAMA